MELIDTRRQVDTNKIALLQDLLQQGYHEKYALLINSKVLVT